MRNLRSSTLHLICLLCSMAAMACPAGAAGGMQGTDQVPAQAAQGKQSLNLMQCIELALTNNQRGKISRDSVEMALSVRQQALSAWWPRVSAGLVASRMDEDPNFVFPASQISLPAGALPIPATSITIPANSFGPGFPPVNMPLTLPPSTVSIPSQTIPVPRQDVKIMNRDNFMASLNVSYPVYTGGLRGSRIRQAKSGLEAARQEERRTDQEIVYDVRRLYYSAVLTRRLVQIGNDSLARMEVTLDLTERLYKTGSGKVKKTDYLRNKAVVETIRSVVAELACKDATVRVALAMTIGSDMAAPPELADAEIPFDARRNDVGQLLELALRANPELARVDAAVAASDAGISAARSGHLPKVALFGTTRRIVNAYDSGLVTPENKSSWTVGIGVEIPIFEGFRVTEQEHEARAGNSKLRHQFALLRDGIALEVRNTCTEFDKAVLQQKSSSDAWQAALENRDLNTRAYQDELVETKDVIEAQLWEAMLAGQYQKTLYDNAELRARLDLLTGVDPGRLQGRK